MDDIHSGPWDLEASTNVIIMERSLSELPQPHPETEAMRATFIAKLRQSYQDLCHSREGNLIFFNFCHLCEVKLNIFLNTKSLFYSILR